MHGIVPLLRRLERLAPAPGTLLAERALQRRSDSKFLLSMAQAEALLCRARPHYGVLHAGGVAAARYRTVYFDTAAFDCLRDHQARRPRRYKVRVRHHVDREKSYLEIKSKVEPGMTCKRRIERAWADEALSPIDRELIAKQTGLAGLAPTLTTCFRRITMLGLFTPERITIDVGIVFATGKRWFWMEGIAVAEVKQAGGDASTPIMRALRDLGLRPESFSKYCTGMALLRHGPAR